MLISGLRVPKPWPGQEPIDTTAWPYTIPCVAQIARQGLEFTSPVTFLVGENGSGKSTLVEAIAEAYGISPRGGRGHMTRKVPVAERSELGRRLQLDLTSQGAKYAVICATHSPVLAATPQASIIELTDHGAQHVKWDDLQLVDHWRRFLARPESYLRHVTSLR